jgi:hypothetical protein
MELKNHKGLGDTVASFTQLTRIDKLAKRIANAVGQEDCGCEERKKLLNEIFPYKIKNQSKK